MIVIDKFGRIGCGTSTNGLSHKIPGWDMETSPLYNNDHLACLVCIGELVIHQLLVLAVMYSRVWAGLLPQEMVTS